MKISHVHCRVRDLPTAARWFEQVLQATPVFNNERMAWLGFGEFGVILDAAPADSARLRSASIATIATPTIAPSPSGARYPSRPRKIAPGVHAPPTSRVRPA
jgi:catechol 2,3-dioxygenase-like lactoylglutathione lyase family enzyme